MASSLRWRLQIWHAVILLGVVLVFGAVLYAQIHRATVDEIDAELLAGARVLEVALRTLPPHVVEGGFRERNDNPGPPNNLGPPPNGGFRPPPRGMEFPRGMDPQRGPAPFPRGPESSPRGPDPNQRGPDPNQRGPGPGQRGMDPQRGPEQSGAMEPLRPRLDRVLSLPPSRFRGPDDTEPYFAVFNSKGDTIRKSADDVSSSFEAMDRGIQFRTVANNREVLLRGPSNSLIIVGRDAQRQMQRLTGWALQLSLIGCGVLALGLLGGWWLTGRAIRPILDISQTATKVSATNLSERIETTKMDLELRELGSVLNSMLGRLEHSFELQSHFTADASHELRTPVSVLLSNCELALSRDRSASEYRNTVEICMKAGTRMKSLVEDLLILAKADAGKLDLHKSHIDLKDLVAESARMFESIAAKNSVTLECQLELAPCQADSNRISQVINNLIANAIHYNRVGGKVILKTMRDGNYAVIQITDTGCGIPEDSLPKLFDRFYRVDEHRSRQHGGSGLGLAICKSIVDAHGGQLTVSSQENIGTTFELRLT
jgi:two-component system, OmpR family, sensor kinase